MRIFYILYVFIQIGQITQKGRPMTIAHSARKIIKTQRFIFRALPAVFAGLSILTACGGGALPNAPLTTPTKTTPCDANSFANGCENTVENKGISGEQPLFSNVLLSVDTTADDTPRDTDIKEVVVKQDAPKPLPPTPNQAQNQPPNQEQNPPAPATSTDYVTYVSPVQRRSFSQSPPLAKPIRKTRPIRVVYRALPAITPLPPPLGRVVSPIYPPTGTRPPRARISAM